MIRRTVRAACGVATDHRVLYVVINLAVSLLVLVRSYVTMLALDYRGLGLVALAQSIVLLIGITQLGFLNGGYRLLCSARPGEAAPIVGTVNAAIAAIGAAAVVAGLGYAMVGGAGAAWVLPVGVVGGVATLSRTWIMNRMIASGDLAALNRINLWSALASLAVLAAIPFASLAACLAALAVQPVVFVVLATLHDRALRPTLFACDRQLARRMLAAGFLLFLSTMLLQANIQLERWYVVGALGVDALGHLFLAILFVTLFQLVPASLDAVYLPRLVQAHEAGGAVGRELTGYLLVLLGYCVVALICVALLAEPLTALLLPKYVADLRYVELIAPGLALATLGGGIAAVFNVRLRFGWLIGAYLAGTAVLAAILGWATLANVRLSLDQVTIARSATLGLSGLLIALGYALTAWQHPAFRPGLPWQRAA